MKNLLNILNSKIFLYVLVGVIVVVFLQSNRCNNSKNEALETYNRQLQGQLSDKEKELQSSNVELGLAKSNLVTRKKLEELLKKDNEEKDKNFEKFKKKYNLKIKNRDKTIAGLKQSITNGQSSVVISNPSTCNIDGCVLSYNWQDNLGRFKLKDPNIFEKNNEVFESNQIFKIYGEIWEESNGSLQTKRLVIREVYKNESGEYEDIEGAKADIIDSEFQYHNPPSIETEWKWSDLFRLRAMALGSIEMLPNNGNLSIGLGLEFMSFYGFGLGSYTALDFKNPENIAQHISLQYNPTILDTELNFGVFLSAGTPFVKFFNEYQFNTGLVFYLNQ